MGLTLSTRTDCLGYIYICTLFNHFELIYVNDKWTVVYFENVLRSGLYMLNVCIASASIENMQYVQQDRITGSH